MDSFPMATQSHTTIRDAPSGAGVFDPYDAMVLEYIEERHIIAYSLLSHHHTTAIQPYRDDSAGEVSSENSLSTNPTKTENSNDLLVLLPDHLAWAEDLQAVVASRYPTPEDEDNGVDWSVALGTYDFLNIEEAKHATARMKVPWREVDHLAEWREETEAFAALWDLLRETAPAIEEPVVVSMLLLGSSCLEGASSLLDVEAGHISLDAPSAEQALDELLPDLRGLNAGI